MKYEIYNLFSKTIYINILEDISDEELLKIKNYIENLSYSSTSYDVTEKKHTKQLYTSSSLSKSILNNTELFFLKKRIMLEFNYFKNNILKYENNEFSYTTSWIAKSTKNQSSEYHNHNNCMFSGIFYVNTEENCGELCFENFSDKRFNLKPSEYNIYNCLNFNFKPKNKMIIFFPSEMYHKILKNNSDIARYSIAFNLIPTGNIGSPTSDSFLKLEINND